MAFFRSRVCARIFILSVLSFGFLCPLASSPLLAVDNDECLACHENLNVDTFAASVHGKNLCTSCHADIKEVPHQEKLNKVNCGSCHKIESDIYLNSDHGRARKSGESAATCLGCHGSPHAILSARNPASPMYRLNIPKTCAGCHEDTAKMAKYALLEEKPLTSYLLTVHGKALEKGVIQSAVCTDCHGSHDLHSPTNPQSKLYRRSVPITCGKCHENVLKSYERSIHGKAALAGKVEAPVCTDCHGEHTILGHKDPASSVYSSSVSEKVCAHCHAAEKIISKYRLPSDSVKTFLESYHGLAGRYGSTVVANCASCHGFHDILPSSDPNSSVNKANLPQTCGKCHPNVGEQLAKGSVHLSPTFDRDRIVYVVSLIYIIFIILVIGGMLAHNLLDFLRKLHEHRRKHLETHQDIRFTKSERIQHGVLTLCFVVLAYTGFALKYSDAWWAYPFTFGNGADWRGWIHRIAAAIFSVLGIYHGLYLLFTKRGRKQVRALAPAKKDFSDVMQMLKHNLGFKVPRPRFKQYNYVEKAEYWALVWGSMVMMLTGLGLVFENLSMKYFPKWFLDVALAIHFYEAVLATLAILVWHFYFVIFDPEHYPLNLSMSTGRETEDRDSDNAPKDSSSKPSSPE